MPYFFPNEICSLLKSQHAGCVLEILSALHFPAWGSQLLTFSINSTKGRTILNSFFPFAFCGCQTFISPFMCFGYSHYREFSCTCCYKHTGLRVSSAAAQCDFLWYTAVRLQSMKPSIARTLFSLFPTKEKRITCSQEDKGSLSALKPPS